MDLQYECIFSAKNLCIKQIARELTCYKGLFLFCRLLCAIHPHIGYFQRSLHGITIDIHLEDDCYLLATRTHSLNRKTEYPILQLDFVYGGLIKGVFDNLSGLC